MGKQKIKGKDLKGIGYQFDQQKSLAINIMMKHFKHLPKVEKMELLRELAANPEKYKDDEHLQPLAETFMEVVEKEEFTSYKLVEQPKKYEVYGKKFIDQNTLKQMDLAMRLPIAHQGALMPDAHVGYGLPIGGVLATKNEVIPYGVGLDIGCRMALTIFDAPFAVATRYKHQFKVAIQEYTFFGTGVFNDLVIEHEIMDRPEFKATEVLSQLHGRARRQLGRKPAEPSWWKLCGIAHTLWFPRSRCYNRAVLHKSGDGCVPITERSAAPGVVGFEQRRRNGILAFDELGG